MQNDGRQGSIDCAARQFVIEYETSHCLLSKRNESSSGLHSDWEACRGRETAAQAAQIAQDAQAAQARIN
jgi:hypothetical protein